MPTVLQNSFDRVYLKQQAKWFKNALYTLLLLHALSCFLDYNALIGSNTFIVRKTGTVTQLRDIVYLMYYHPTYAWLYLITIITLCITALAGKRNMVVDALLCFLQINLHQALYAGLTGGHQLLQQLLLFNILVHGNGETCQSALRRWLHNMGVLACIAQVLVVYAVAAISKWQSPSWRSGEAIAQTLSIQHLHLSAPLNLPSIISKLLSYTVLLYQSAFPLLLIFKKLRKPLVAMAAIMYLYIGLFMGIVLFATVMLIAHLYFWPSKPSKS